MEKSFETAAPNPDIEGVTDILPEELALKLHSALLVDVRQPDEFEGGSALDRFKQPAG
jgi:rhodanese-related sulfurtransferase